MKSVVKNIREEIIRLGGEVCFNTRLADIDTDGKVTSADSLAVLRASVKLFDEDNKSVGTEIELAEK